MRLKRQRQAGNDLPEINLVPMMDVLMTVLTFFIIVSMTLTGQVVSVFLPEAATEGKQEEEETAPPAMVIGLNVDREILLNNQPATLDQMVQEVQTYFAENPEGTVTLKADRELQYQEVANLLKSLRNIGGGRVSLAIDLQ
jgi:biopolymer transport protein ExbD